MPLSSEVKGRQYIMGLAAPGIVISLAVVLGVSIVTVIVGYLPSSTACFSSAEISASVE